jgi:Tfp pilus assembly protein PilN
MTTQPPADPPVTPQSRSGMSRSRIQRIAAVILPLLLLFMLLAQWMEARERGTKLQELQTRIDALQAEIDKARARIDNASPKR